ncbi:hypothetical protein MJO47_03205 [Desulfuromonas sp. KJ2020]|uniref:hypothetical protein n=1 Tax=Desulfuromonas sp. KJ2020 TaxID=2919173 RepID=UPI0020A7E7DB|nr:hypothetical protein [Desulfuromonas sp. KJ2020]MCP3176100.1 hypothetical protein [Desulfuromonas sp. KJ2020]
MNAANCNGVIGPDELMLLAQAHIEILIRVGKLGEGFARPHRMSEQAFKEARDLFRQIRARGLDWSMSEWIEVFQELYDGDMEKVKIVLYQGLSIPVLH